MVICFYFLFRLVECGLTAGSCVTVVEVLSSRPCFISELDLSNNDLQSRGVMEICEKLKIPHSNLKILRYVNINLNYMTKSMWMANHDPHMWFQTFAKILQSQKHTAVENVSVSWTFTLVLPWNKKSKCCSIMTVSLCIKQFHEDMC